MIQSPEFKVGALVAIVAALIGFMSLKVNQGPGLFERTKSYYFDLDNANGLIPNGPVKEAGIKVGNIEKIKLVNGKARVFIEVTGSVKMHTSGYVELVSDGILGDRHVELVPGNPKDPELPDGSQILTATEGGSVTSLLTQISKIAKSLNDVATTLKRATGRNGDNTTVLGRIMMNIEKVSGDLAQITGKNKHKLTSIISNINVITSELAKVMKDHGPQGFDSTWHNLSTGINRLQKSADNIEQITDKINSGKGTIGQLVNDDSTSNKINSDLDKLDNFLGGAQSMETAFDYHSEYLAAPGLIQSFLNIRIQPGLDRYYEVGIVDDPRGYVTVTRQQDSGTLNQDYTETMTYHNQLKFNALFAKNFYNFTVKAGLMESSGGVGLDYFLFGRKLRASVEAFDFQDTVIRAYLRYNLFKGLYLVGGGDNLANPALRSAFIGAGLFLTNDDLKLFATRYAF